MVYDYKVSRIVEEPTLRDGKAAADLRVEFTVGDDGPFFERFDKGTATEHTIQARLRDLARMIQMVRGA